PINKSPCTFHDIKISVRKSPTNVSNVIEACKYPRPTVKSSCATTKPDIYRPKNEINRRISKVIPNLTDAGTTLINDYRKFVKLNKMKTTPARKTAPKTT